MTRDRFQDLLDSRGSDLATWPDADRIAADHLMASDPGAAKAFEEARNLDRLIGRSLGAAAPDGDHEAIAPRILAGLPKKLPAQADRGIRLPIQATPRKNRRAWAFLPAQGALLPRVAALSFAAALGVALGLFWAQTSMLDDRQPMITASEEGGTDVTGIIFQTDTTIGIF
jgi:hypothetical protein